MSQKRDKSDTNRYYFKSKLKRKSQDTQLPYLCSMLTSELLVGKKLPGHNFKGSGFRKRFL